MIYEKKKIAPNFDPWESYIDMAEHGKLTLSNIEFTTTYLCNMRCEHCAVGYTLQPKDPDGLPIELLLQRLDEIPYLRTVKYHWRRAHFIEEICRSIRCPSIEVCS